MNLSKLQKDARFLVFGDSTNTNYEDDDLNSNINNWYATAMSWIIEASGTWQVNGEITETDLVAGQREYILPTDLLRISEVYVYYNGEYVKADIIDPSRLSEDPDTDYTPIKPMYDLMDNSLFLYLPVAITDIANGLKIHYQTEIINDLANAGDIPNINKNFQRILSTGAAADYCLANEMSKKQSSLENRIFQMYKPDLIKDYSIKNTKPVIMEAEEENLY